MFFSSTRQLVYAPHNGYFEGQHKICTCLFSGKFKAVGRFLGHSIIHGRPSCCMCDTILDFMMGTQISQLNVPMSYVVSPDVKNIVYALMKKLT